MANENTNTSEKIQGYDSKNQEWVMEQKTGYVVVYARTPYRQIMQAETVKQFANVKKAQAYVETLNLRNFFS